MPTETLRWPIGSMKAVSRNVADVVVCLDVSRLGRFLQYLVSLLGQLHAKNVGIYLHIQASTPLLRQAKPCVG